MVVVWWLTSPALPHQEVHRPMCVGAALVVVCVVVVVCGSKRRKEGEGVRKCGGCGGGCGNGGGADATLKCARVCPYAHQGKPLLGTAQSHCLATHSARHLRRQVHERYLPLVSTNANAVVKAKQIQHPPHRISQRRVPSTTRRTPEVSTFATLWRWKTLSWHWPGLTVP